jgi:methylase of polypeptide subunit release factors
MTIHTLKKEFLPLLAPEDFYVLLAHASGKSREYLLAHPEYGIDTETETRARDFFTRRLAHEPVAYIVGEKEFFRLPFRITSDTLIRDRRRNYSWNKSSNS